MMPTDILMTDKYKYLSIIKYFSLYFVTMLEWWWNTTESQHIDYVILIPPLQTTIIISNSFLSSTKIRRRRVNIVSISEKHRVSEYVLCVHFLPAQGTPSPFNYKSLKFVINHGMDLFKKILHIKMQDFKWVKPIMKKTK